VNMKALAAGVVIVLAIVIGAYIYLNQPQELKDPWAGREQAYMEDFADNLGPATEVYFVMDLRGADVPTQRNIMQCSADMAFSSALGGKRREIYSLDQECLRLGDAEGEDAATLTLAQCLSEIDTARGNLSKSIFYVRKANETMVFENELVIGMAENYTYMGCSISAESHTAPAANINQTIVEQTWQELTNRTGAGSNSTNGTSN
jgi:hypothetical protein